MALANQSIQIACDKQLEIHCPGCHMALEEDEIAMLLRKQKGGVFEAMCVDCTHDLIRAAGQQLQLEDAISRLFK